jgi:hypothetical protein
LPVCEPPGDELREQMSLRVCVGLFAGRRKGKKGKKKKIKIRREIHDLKKC